MKPIKSIPSLDELNEAASKWLECEIEIHRAGGANPLIRHLIEVTRSESLSSEVVKTLIAIPASVYAAIEKYPEFKKQLPQDLVVELMKAAQLLCKQLACLRAQQLLARAEGREPKGEIDEPEPYQPTVELTWECHVCGKTRPDDKISVISTDRSIENKLPPGTCHENVRYCNDNPECCRAAPSKRLFNINGLIKEQTPDGQGPLP